MDVQQVSWQCGSNWVCPAVGPRVRTPVRSHSQSLLNLLHVVLGDDRYVPTDRNPVGVP